MAELPTPPCSWETQRRPPLHAQDGVQGPWAASTAGACFPGAPSSLLPLPRSPGPGEHPQPISGGVPQADPLPGAGKSLGWWQGHQGACRDMGATCSLHFAALWVQLAEG